ncbi:MAG: hypothetical protein IJV16_04270 [Lachnospiraceae bacterium]|nr:hypothetical protein [Lachnospiraceae bacterium]
MAGNILLTSLSAVEGTLPMRYYSIQNEFGFDYCDALQDTEAGIKAMLARYDIDEIIVIGGAGAYDKEDNLDPVPLTNGRALYSADISSLSAYALLQYRIAQHADELTADDSKADGCLSGEVREKLIRFIRDYQDGNDGFKTKKLNRLFDELSQNDQICDSFWTALFDSFPDLRDDQASCKQWVKSYLYSELKATAKLELLPINENTTIRLIPEDRIEDKGLWADSMVTMQKSIVEDKKDINLYILLNSDDAADTFVVLNMLDILVSMPGSDTRLKTIFSVRSLQRRMTGIIRDDTAGFGVTELFHAISSFLNYGKADRIVDIWEKSGEQNGSIAGMVYAMRHVDVGLSMCNIPEVEKGILRLRGLFKGEKLWRDFGYYGVLFGVIAESIREDYGTLLEGDGDIPFIDLVKWAYRHQFYQQTLTLIEAKAPKNLVESGIFYYCDDEKQMDQVARLFAQRRMELKPYEYYKIEHIDHYFIKTCDRGKTRGMGEKGEDQQHVYAALRTRSVGNNDPSQITGFTACDSMETLQNLLYAYYHLGDVRNKISHAEAEVLADKRLMVSESDDSSALVWMKDGIDYFIDSYEKAMAEVQSKKPHVVTITGEYVKITAERMKKQ